MFFTEEDYKKIEKYLASCGVKDSCLEGVVLPFQGNEKITIVQDGKNRTLYFRELIEALKHSKAALSDLYNVTDHAKEKYINLKQAIELVPYKARKIGQIITFLNPASKWELYQFQGTSILQWNELSLWNDFFNLDSYVIKSILPDEEDLTKSENDGKGNSYLSLKDREYNPDEFSGLGKVILRKNIMEVETEGYGKVKKNVLLQDMVNKPNTIYEIRYDFDLNNQEITIPEGCVLDFKGGSLSNGNIDCNNIIFKNNIKGNINIKGTYYKYNYVIPKNIDVTFLLQKILDEIGVLFLEKGTYLISRPLVISKYNTLIIGEGEDTCIKPTTNIDSIISTENRNTLTFIVIKNLCIDGNNKAIKGINFIKASNCFFENILVKYCNIGMRICGWSHSFINCSCMYNKFGGFFVDAFNQCTLLGCFFNSNKVGFYAEGNSVLFLNCDIEKNSSVGCICGGLSVKFDTCYFEHNSSQGLQYKSRESSSSEDYYWFPEGEAAYTKVIKTDIITRVNPTISDTGIIGIAFSTAWIADVVEVSNSTFTTSSINCAIIGSISVLNFHDNIYVGNYECVYGIIPVITTTIIKQMNIYNNHYKRGTSDISFIKKVQSIKPFYDNKNDIYKVYWNFIKGNNHKIDTDFDYVDYCKNIYNFIGRVSSSNSNPQQTKIAIYNYNKNQVIYQLDLSNNTNYSCGFHLDPSIYKIQKNTLYCFEADLKLKDFLNENEEIIFSFFKAGEYSIDYKIENLKTDSYTKIFYYFYYDENQPSQVPESNIWGKNIKTQKILYIKNPKFYNICNIKENSNYYLDYIEFASSYPVDNFRPYTSGIKVGEQISYSGDNEDLKNRNLICIKRGENFQCDEWANIQYLSSNKNNSIKSFYIDLNKFINKSSGTFAQKPTTTDNIPVGFEYFCTDKQTTEGTTNGIMIYHKGDNVWVDALGRVVS